MGTVVLLDELNRLLEPGPTLVFTFFVIVPALRIGEDIGAAIGRAKKHPSSLLANDRDVFIQCARPAAGIENRGRAVL